jgi:hypothetical protein
MKRRCLLLGCLLGIIMVTGRGPKFLEWVLQISEGSDLSYRFPAFTDAGGNGFVFRFAPGTEIDRPVNLEKVHSLGRELPSTRRPSPALRGWTDLQVDPTALFSHTFHWGGPIDQPELQYLEVFADNEYYAFTMPLYVDGKNDGQTRIDPNQFPILQITWMVDQFAEGADLYHYYKVDRAIGIIVTFGPPIPSNIPGHRVPRGFSFVWAGPEGNEEPGDVLSCQPSLEIPHKKLFCHVPQVKYVVMRKGGAGVIRRDHINLVTLFAHYFPEHYRQTGRIPPVAAITIEAKTTEPMARGTQSRARLYDISFLPQS